MKDMLVMLIELGMVLVIMFVCGAAVYALSGCTAAGVSQQQAAAAHAKGFFCHADEAKGMTSAVGEAAVAAAKKGQVRAVEVTGKQSTQ